MRPFEHARDFVFINAFQRNHIDLQRNASVLGRIGAAQNLRQAGVTKTTYVRLADVGIHGNGHMMMLEKNNMDIVGVAGKWLRETIKPEKAKK